LSGQLKLAGLPGARPEGCGEVFLKRDPVFRRDEPEERPVPHASPLMTQYGAGHEVDFLDESRAVQGEIADRSKVVELRVARPGRLEFGLRRAKRLVLHLQLYLGDIQLMEEPLHVLHILGERFRDLGAHFCKLLFRPMAQLIELVRRLIGRFRRHVLSYNDCITSLNASKIIRVLSSLTQWNASSHLYW
jgi:hypothetical protein